MLLVGANAFFVAAEFALVSARDTKLAQLTAHGDRLARVVRTAQHDLNLYLSSCQVGITLASLGLGWVGEPAIAQTLVVWFSGLPSPFDFIARHAVAVTIAFAGITYLHVVFGEMAPKALAIFHPGTRRQRAPPRYPGAASSPLAQLCGLDRKPRRSSLVHPAPPCPVPDSS